MDPILGAEVGGAAGGGFFDGWGDMIKDTVGFGLKSAIDAEFNYPHQIAQRQMELMGDDGELFGAGSVGGGANWLPWAIGAAVVIGAIVLLKD